MAFEADFGPLLARLEELEKKAGKTISDTALRKGAEIVLEQQKAQVPKDTRELLNSLIVGKISGAGDKRKILVGINPAKSEEVKYGYYQEHGTSVMLGKKWMKRSWQQSNAEAQRKIAESIANDLGGL